MCSVKDCLLRQLCVTCFHAEAEGSTAETSCILNVNMWVFCFAWTQDFGCRMSKKASRFLPNIPSCQANASEYCRRCTEHRCSALVNKAKEYRQVQRPDRQYTRRQAFLLLALSNAQLGWYHWYEIYTTGKCVKSLLACSFKPS